MSILLSDCVLRTSIMVHGVHGIDPRPEQTDSRRRLAVETGVLI